MEELLARVADLSARILILEENEAKLLKALKDSNSYNQYLLECNETLTHKLNVATGNDGPDYSDSESSSDSEAETVEEVVMKDVTSQQGEQEDEEFPQLGTKTNKKRGKASDGSTSPILPKKAKNVESINKGATQKKTKPEIYIKKKEEGKKTAAPPAIMVYAKGHKKLNNDIKAVTGNGNTTLKISGERTRVQTATKEDYVKVKSHFEKEKVEMYTFTPREEKPFTMVIKNIPTEYNEGEIKQVLDEMFPEQILCVKHLARHNWVVQIKTRETRSEFLRMKYILGYKVQIEGFRGQKVSQCKNCQRYNHLAMNCGMNYRCVKCAQGHGPQKCPIPKKEENNKEIVENAKDGTIKVSRGIPLKCANCGGAHAASYKGCAVRKQLLLKKTMNETRRQPNIPTRFVQKNVSYSSVAKTAQQPKATASTSQAGSGKFNIEEEMQNLFGKSLITVLKKFNDFAPTWDKLKTRRFEERQSAMYSLLFDVTLN
jgi:hypothetical protein